MKSFKLVFLNIISVFIIFGCSKEVENIENPNLLDPSKAYEELNIAYGSNVNQKFDLYLPANRTSSTKVVILVHGGGWSTGDKSDMTFLKDLILQDFPNLAVVNINYRLADGNNPPYPMQINDITSVIDYLKDKNTYYNISSNYGFIGISAGAHLSLLWSYAFDTGTNIKMVASIVGPTNFSDPAYINSNNPELQGYLDLYGINPTTDFLEEISPYHQVTASAPPTILFYAGQDQLVPMSQGTDLNDKLQTLGVTHEFTLYPNAGHELGFLEILDAWGKLKLFMQGHL